MITAAQCCIVRFPLKTHNMLVLDMIERVACRKINVTKINVTLFSLSRTEYT
jgi:hypothetical protein